MHHRGFLAPLTLLGYGNLSSSSSFLEESHFRFTQNLQHYLFLFFVCFIHVLAEDDLSRNLKFSIKKNTSWVK